MTTRSFRRFLIFALLPIMLVASPGAGDTQQALHLELNKMLTEQGRCRIFFVVENPLDRAFSELILDVAFFDKKGIIIGRSDIDLGQGPWAENNGALCQFCGIRLRHGWQGPTERCSGVWASNYCRRTPGLP